MTPPQHLEVLLAECKANPRDVVPRRVLGDWLMEHATHEIDCVRGEFIHVQLDLATLPAADPGRRVRAGQEQQMLLAHEQHWLGPWASHCPRGGEWVRGLLRLRLFGMDWLQGEICQPHAWGWVEELILRGLEQNHLPRLVGAEGLAQLTILDLGYNLIRGEGAYVLAHSPQLAQLRCLNLHSNGIGSSGMAALASSAHLPRLTWLDLEDNNLGAEGIAALAGSALLSQLDFLHLGNNVMGSEGAQLLASSPHLAQLTHLNLRNNVIGADGARALASSRYLARLSTLDLRGNGISSQAQTVLRQRFGRALTVD